MRRMANSVVELSQHVADEQIIKFRTKEVDNHRLILVLGVECDGCVHIVINEIGTNKAASPGSTSNSANLRSATSE